MNILITSAATQLARELAKGLTSSHQIRLTEFVEVKTNGEFVRCALNSGEETDELVENMDVIIHLAELPSAKVKGSAQPESVKIDYQSRCTYNLLNAAADAKVPHAIYASTLRLFDKHDEDWTVTEWWCPAPTTDVDVLSRHLGEFTCREFAEENRINITVLRLGALVTAAEAKGQPLNTSWLEISDAVHAFERALDSQPPPWHWQVFHIQSEFPQARFSTELAQNSMQFKPEFKPGTKE